MFFGCILLDGESYELYDYFDRTGDVLDEAGGDYIRLLAVGDPGRSGRIHKRLLSEQQRERDAEDARTYPQEIFQTGREPSHRRDEVKIVRERLGLAASDLPCIAFVCRLDPPILGILRIAPSWYESPPAMNRFGRSLRSWQSREDVRSLAMADLDEATLVARLGSSLASLTAEINASVGPGGLGVHASDKGRSRTRPVKEGVSFETPPAARWEDVRIRFVDGHTISVAVLGVKGRFNCAEMGMADDRTKNPTVQWRLLMGFARDHGRMEWDSPEADRKNQKRRERLADDLRRFFRIDGDPICLTPDRKGWRTRFNLAPNS
jgi:hypothetical protein